MVGKPALDVDLARLAPATMVADLIYTPLETPFLAQARERGCVTVNGLGLLLNQAKLAFKAWFGVHPGCHARAYQGRSRHLLKAPSRSFAAMTIPAGRKIDCHIHALDPVRFPYADDTPYRPSGQEIAPAAHLIRVLDAFDVRHALIVGTNSGYGTDSRILLDTLRQGNGRFKGVAVVENDVDIGELERLKAAGIIGVAFNCRFTAPAIIATPPPCWKSWSISDCSCRSRSRKTSCSTLLPLIEKSSVRLVFDHCGRPSVAHGLQQTGIPGAAGDRPRARRLYKAVGLLQVLAASRIRTRIRGRLSLPWSRPSRSIAASGDRTGRSCARRSGWITGRCSRCCLFCFRTLTISIDCCGGRLRGCLGLADAEEINQDR